jgi:hypothetical protein
MLGNIQEIIQQSGGLRSIARELGLSEQQAAQGAQALGPSVLDGVERQAQGGSTGEAAGFGGLGELLGRFGGGDLLDNLTSDAPTDIGRGNGILGEIFGSKDVSRNVAQQASARTGLDQSVLKKMLPMVAMMVTGYLAKQRMAAASAGTGGVGGLGSLVGDALGKFTRR